MRLTTVLQKKQKNNGQLFSLALFNVFYCYDEDATIDMDQIIENKDSIHKRKNFIQKNYHYFSLL